jgi:anti-sigma-K factor RskA
MSVHEQFAEDLALYALGGLEGDERAQLEKHLEGCAGCRRELEQLRGDMALMALSAAGPAPPRRARQRLLEAVGRERRSPAAPARRSWWTLVPWVAAATLAVGLVSVWRQKSDLQRQIADLQNESARQFEELRQAREVVSTLTATDALRVTVVAAKTPPQPQGKAIYVRDRSSLIFLASNFPALPPQKAYELWLVPTSGAPIAAGVFKPDTHGSAIVINPPLPAGVEAKAFAITVEPESGSPAATSPIIMFGAGE